jgi:HSP20 family protein
MNIVSYRTAGNVPTLASLVDRLFDHSLNRGVWESTFSPRADVIESEKAFEIQLAVPGMKKEDFKIELQGDHLVVSGERKAPADKQTSHYHVQEMVHGTFKRSFYLPETANTPAISANYNQGILEILVPKDEKKNLKHVIEVK